MRLIRKQAVQRDCTTHCLVGAELARDGGGSAAIIFNWQTAIASKLSSHRNVQRMGILDTALNPCRS
ncbi:hypothetical protein C9I50_18555 [Pseudomonas prosekii]|nr:hypothetical protein C9I50_18555 [Pseudomonas prosekii]